MLLVLMIIQVFVVFEIDIASNARVLVFLVSHLILCNLELPDMKNVIQNFILFPRFLFSNFSLFISHFFCWSQKFVKI